MSNATVYCAAPTSVVEPLIGDLSQYEEVADENDGYLDYQSLVELWAPTADEVRARAEALAAVLDAAGVTVAISLDQAPQVYQRPATRRSA